MSAAVPGLDHSPGARHANAVSTTGTKRYAPTGAAACYDVVTCYDLLVRWAAAHGGPSPSSHVYQYEAVEPVRPCMKRRI